MIDFVTLLISRINSINNNKDSAKGIFKSLNLDEKQLTRI